MIREQHLPHITTDQRHRQRPHHDFTKVHLSQVVVNDVKYDCTCNKYYEIGHKRTLTTSWSVKREVESGDEDPKVNIDSPGSVIWRIHSIQVGYGRLSLLLMLRYLHFLLIVCTLTLSLARPRQMFAKKYLVSSWPVVSNFPFVDHFILVLSLEAKRWYNKDPLFVSSFLPNNTAFRFKQQQH